ncbi:hypothetical protein LCGC14_1539490 [marine sediment metagenome]|uniref:Uncharacterized protein n=1 Tax=marine sediment metagenome TaxID=412755 RepID=A0A0F9ITM1_9ZZZZ
MGGIKAVPFCRFYSWESGKALCLASGVHEYPGLKCHEMRPECPSYKHSVWFGAGREDTSE